MQTQPNYKGDKYYHIAKTMYAAYGGRKPDAIEGFAVHLRGGSTKYLGKAAFAVTDHFPGLWAPNASEFKALAAKLERADVRQTNQPFQPSPGKPRALPADNPFEQLARSMEKETRESGRSGNAPPPPEVAKRWSLQLQSMLGGICR